MTLREERIGWLRTLVGAYRERIARHGADPDDPDAEREMLAECERLADELQAELPTQPSVWGKLGQVCAPDPAGVTILEVTDPDVKPVEFVYRAEPPPDPKEK